VRDANINGLQEILLRNPWFVRNANLLIGIFRKKEKEEKND